MTKLHTLNCVLFKSGFGEVRVLFSCSLPCNLKVSRGQFFSFSFFLLSVTFQNTKPAVVYFIHSD